MRRVLMTMEYTGLVVVPPATASNGASPTPATRRVGNRPIVAHAVAALATAGIDDIAVVAPPAQLAEVEQCMEEDRPEVRLTLLAQQRRSDLLGALATAAPFVDGRAAIVHAGDGLLAQPLDRVVDPRPDGTAPDLLLLLHRGDGGDRGLAVGAQRLLGLTELHGRGDRLALTEVCAFGPGALRRAIRTRPEVGPGGLLAIAEALAAEGDMLEAEVVRGWRRYLGDPADLLELNRIVLDQQVVTHEVIDRGDNRIEGRAVVHPTAELRSSIILGPCIIGPHARVESSYIGPYTSIGARAEIEGAEIVRSIVAEDVRIRNISGRIEGSTIGRHANIFRDFALPRAMRLHVGEGVEVALN